MNLNDFIDPYNYRARLFPAFLALLPIIAAVAIKTSWLQVEAKGLLSLIPLSAALLLLTVIARHSGKRVESDLIREWGGLPSVTMLRYRDNRIDAVTKARYHSEAQSLIPQLTIPTGQKEATEPQAADAVYQSISNWLRAQTRDKKRFYLIFEENMNYGFQRNLYGLKVPALIFLVGTISYIAFDSRDRLAALQTLPVTDVALVFGCVVGVIIWLVAITKRGVGSAADAYARQLLMALDMLFEPKAK